MKKSADSQDIQFRFKQKNNRHTPLIPIMRLPLIVCLNKKYLV